MVRGAVLPPVPGVGPGGWERAARLEREQRLIAEQARLRERARIAQDMHDVLGHELSLIALSAGALKLAPGLADGHREAARDIRARAAAAVDRLGEVIGVLRQEQDGAPPEPGGAGWRSWSSGRRRRGSRSGCGPTAGPANCRRTWRAPCTVWCKRR
ncbi:hypothetical protein GCM10017744_019570 [Streptomyces antimycoticus]